MTSERQFEHEPRLILRGVNLGLTPAMRVALTTKAERLFRHEPRILRVRIDVAHALRDRVRVFRATGRVEIAGPDLTNSVTTADAYASINRLIDKLDRMLRRRTTTTIRRRSTGDIRAYGPSSPAADSGARTGPRPKARIRSGVRRD